MVAVFHKLGAGRHFSCFPHIYILIRPSSLQFFSPYFPSQELPHYFWATSNAYMSSQASTSRSGLRRFTSVKPGVPMSIFKTQLTGELRTEQVWNAYGFCSMKALDILNGAVSMSVTAVTANFQVQKMNRSMSTHQILPPIILLRASR
ncbi:hypothetical protein WAI453_003445 [Rhynchosporium graminicola]